MVQSPPEGFPTVSPYLLYEDLDAASIKRVLDAFRRGETPKPGPQVNRQTSAPEGGPTTLTTLKGE